MINVLGRVGSWLRKWRLRAGAHNDLGRRGETLAADFLRTRGYRILHRNLSIGDDEADLVVVSPDQATIVVVEVKTRAGNASPPEAAIDRRKQYRLARLASRMRKRRAFARKLIRFDAIAIVWPHQGEPVIRHTECAFESPF